MAFERKRHGFLGLLVADAEVPRHGVEHDPLRAIGPRRALSRQFRDRIAEGFGQIGLRARAATMVGWPTADTATLPIGLREPAPPPRHPSLRGGPSATA